MKFGKFKGMIPFLKRSKTEEINSEIAAESEEQQYELSSGQETGGLQEGEQGNDSNRSQDEPAYQAGASPIEERKEPSMKSTENKGTPGNEPAGGQPGEPQCDKNEGSKAGSLMNELLREAQSTGGNSPIHLLAKSLDDVDINYLLTEGRTIVVRLKRRTGKIK